MKRIIFIAVLVMSIFVINNLVHSIFTLWQKSDLIDKAESELDEQKEENQRLKSELSFVESDEFVEEIARNKLLLVKPGEENIIIPEGLIMGESTDSAELEDELSNWEKWWKLFF